MAKGRILRLRGLPWSAGEEEVRSFLESYSPQDIYLRKRGEKSTGEAFVEFETTEQAVEAQADRNHKDLGERYIEIFATDAESMDTLRGEIEEHDTGWVVRLRGLPFTATADEVLEFFDGLEVVGGADGVVFTWGRDGRPLGEAYVEFPTEEVQQEAMARDRNKMGPRYIELFKSTKADKNVRAGAMRRSEPGGRGDWPAFAGRGQGRGRMSEPGDQEYSLPFLPMPPQSGTASAMDGSTLRLRGLPYSATVEDITEFFADFAIGPEAVQIMTRQGRDGQPQGTGMAYVQFPSPADAEAARAERHRKSMGTRYIECLPMWPMARGPLQQPAILQGPIQLPAGPRGPFMPRGMAPMSSMPSGMPHPPMPGAYGYEVAPRGPQPAGPAMRMPPYMMRPQQPPPPPNQAMIAMGMPGRPYDPRTIRQGPLGPPSGIAGGQPPPPLGRIQPKGGWRSGSRRASSPGPPMSLQGGGSAAAGPPSAAEFQQQQQQQHHQQQMLMQHQFIMHQHLMQQQQQAISHMRPGWGHGMGPMGGPFVTPFGTAMGPRGLQARAPPQALRSIYATPGQPTAGPPSRAHLPAAQPQSAMPAESAAGPSGPLIHGGAVTAPVSAPSTPGFASTTPGTHASGLSPGAGGVQAGISPSGSLRSEGVPSLNLASRSQSSASRAASGAIAPAQSAGLHPGIPTSSASATLPGQQES